MSLDGITYFPQEFANKDFITSMLAKRDILMRASTIKNKWSHELKVDEQVDQFIKLTDSHAMPHSPVVISPVHRVAYDDDQELARDSSPSEEEDEESSEEEKSEEISESHSLEQ